MPTRLCGHLVAALGLVGLTACGSSSTSPSTQLSQTDITHIAAAVGPAVSLALSSMSRASATFSVRSVAAEVRPRATTTFTVPISGTAPCPDSGSTTISGSVSGSISDSGSGSETMSMQIGFSNCKSSGILLQGNPNLTFSGQFNFSNAILANGSTFTLGGGITFVLNGVTGSAAFACTDSINGATFAVTQSGNVTFQYGQGTSTTSCSSFG